MTNTAHLIAKLNNQLRRANWVSMESKPERIVTPMPYSAKSAAFFSAKHKEIAANAELILHAYASH